LTRSVARNALEALADEQAAEAQRLFGDEGLISGGGQHQRNARKIVEEVFLQQRNDLL
jgi:hypothetical protein